ncbi:hypothetical protein HRbin15_00962 [bacterium HR15]|nr:hypothetical protein HRbin15_00962 [bacterium HR15]
MYNSTGVGRLTCLANIKQKDGEHDGEGQVWDG